MNIRVTTILSYFEHLGRFCQDNIQFSFGGLGYSVKVLNVLPRSCDFLSTEAKNPLFGGNGAWVTMRSPVTYKIRISSSQTKWTIRWHQIYIRFAYSSAAMSLWQIMFADRNRTVTRLWSLVENLTSSLKVVSISGQPVLRNAKKRLISFVDRVDSPVQWSKCVWDSSVLLLFIPSGHSKLFSRPSVIIRVPISCSKWMVMRGFENQTNVGKSLDSPRVFLPSDVTSISQLDAFRTSCCWFLRHPNHWARHFGSG